jgi:hypothetical protein
MKKGNFWNVMILVTCASLSANHDPSCAALKKVGGVAKSVYFGHTGEIATMTFATDGDIATHTLQASTYLYKYTSKNEKINVTWNIVEGENTNVFAHSITIQLYHATQAEKKAIQALAKADDMYCIVELLSGELIVLGINNPSVSSIGGFDEFGLKATAGEGGSGVLLNDATAYSVTLSRNVPCWPMHYKPGTALATNIAALDAMLV